MAIVTWRGNSGSWTDPLSWQTLQQPGPQDAATFSATNTSIATLAGSAEIGSIAFAAGGASTLLLQGTLVLHGSLALGSGTLDLAAGGTIEGGTVDLAGGTLINAGGVADGVVWLGALGNGLTITAATAAATQAVTGTLNVTGTLDLASGIYDSVGFGVSAFVTGSAHINAVADGTVTLGSAATLFATSDDPGHQPQVSPALAGLTLGGSGSFINTGLIVSDLAAAFTPLTIDSAGFLNAGQLSLDVATVADLQQTFTVLQGRLPHLVTLTYTATYAAGLLEHASSFHNGGTITGQAASMDVTGASFVNSGFINLGTMQAEIPVATATTAYVETITLLSTLDISASVQTFSNTGTIDASSIEFDDNLTLAQLGTLRGAVVFRGTMDLGGGTLDVGKLDPTGSFTFDGTVKNGTLIRDSGTLTTAGATLSGVVMLDQAPGVVLDVVSGSVTLDASTTELAYTTTASVDQLAVVAGAAGVVDLIGARAPGTLNFGSATTITDTLAGSTIDIGGQGTFSDAGHILLQGATLGIATLDGTGTIALADGAALQIGSLAANAAVIVDFGTGRNLLSLPTDASGLNVLGLVLRGLQTGDVIDFAGLSSNPPIGSFGNPGAGVQNGTLDVEGSSGARASITLGDGGAGLAFLVSSDATGGTLVTVTCFLRGTRIATPLGEMPVEQLRIGDLVTTATGDFRPIKWLGYRSYAGAILAANRQLLPVRLFAGSLGGGIPTRDLFVSPLHALLLSAPDGARVLVQAVCLVNGRTIDRPSVRAVDYVHIELDSHDVVLAEGAAAETFVDYASRALFENAAEFATLYPGGSPLSPRSCAPRVEGGWLLEAIRAGLPGAKGRESEGGALRWHIDRQSNGRIEGWALDGNALGEPVELELLTDMEQIGCVVANRYRVDLDHAGLGGGRCGFSVGLPDIAPAALAAVRVRALATGLLLTR